MDHVHTEVAISDPELGVIVVATADDGTTTTGGSDGFAQSPHVSRMLAQLRHPGWGAAR